MSLLTAQLVIHPNADSGYLLAAILINISPAEGRARLAFRNACSFPSSAPR